MRNSVARNNHTTKMLRRALLYRGLITTVSRRLGRSKGHVSRVARGRRRSPKVEAALAAEVKRLERRNGGGRG